MPPPAFDASPFPDVPTPGAPPPFAAQHDPFLAAAGTPFDAPPPFVGRRIHSSRRRSLQDEEPFTGAQPPAGDTYLSAARRSAQAAASAAEAEQGSRGFAWGAAKAAAPDQVSGGRSRTVLLAFVTLIVIALVAGIVLSQGSRRAIAAVERQAQMLFAEAADHACAASGHTAACDIAAS